VPAGYAPTPTALELLKHKSLHATGAGSRPTGCTSGGAGRGPDAWRELTALNAWLADNVGATTKEPRRR
jgi:hypothetical protein